MVEIETAFNFFIILRLAQNFIIFKAFFNFFRFFVLTAGRAALLAAKPWAMRLYGRNYGNRGVETIHELSLR